MKNNNFALKKLRILIVALTLTAMLTTLTGCFGIPGINSEDYSDNANLSSDDYDSNYSESDSSDSSESDSSDESNSSDEESSSPSSSGESYGLNETAELNTINVTATSVDESHGSDLFPAETNKIFVGVEITIENTSSEDVSISSLLNFEAYVDDVSTVASLPAGVVFGSTIDGTIAPGKKLIGYYAMEVPEDWGEIELYFKEDIFDRESKTMFLLANS